MIHSYKLRDKWNMKLDWNNIHYLHMCTIHVPCGIPEQPVHYVTIWVKAINNRKRCL